MSSDYGKGKIYKLVNNVSEKCYIGSTICSLCLRIARHRADYRHYLNGAKNYITSYQIFEEAYENNDKVSVILIENYPCRSIEELKSRERYYIENDCNSVNKNIPTQTQKEWYLKNKEKLIINKKMWQKLNKQNDREKVKCECNRYVQRIRLEKHKLTKLHKRALNRLNIMNHILAYDNETSENDDLSETSSDNNNNITV